MLVDKLTEEMDEHIIAKTLKLIRRLLDAEHGCPEVLKTPAISRLTYLLSHSNPKVKNAFILNEDKRERLRVSQRHQLQRPGQEQNNRGRLRAQDLRPLDR